MIEIKNISKKYKLGDNISYALSDLSLDIQDGEVVVILGPSGSGKSTLLNCISGLDRVSSGNIYFNKINITKYSDKKITKFRKDNIGFIFQTYNLLEHLNVYENILVGKKLSKNPLDIDDIIKTVGLQKHKHKKMHELSGGEMQRVSIARAIVKNSKVMFCDEPTGALDEETGKKVLKCLIDVNNKYHTTLVIITHNPGIALIGDKIIKMNSGKIISIEENERTNPLDIPWG